MREIGCRPDHSNESEESQFRYTWPGLRSGIEYSTSDASSEILLHEREFRYVVGSGCQRVGVREREEMWEKGIDGDEGGSGRIGREV